MEYNPPYESPIEQELFTKLCFGQHDELITSNGHRLRQGPESNRFSGGCKSRRGPSSPLSVSMISNGLGGPSLTPGPFRFAQWRNFKGAIKKGIVACERSGNNPADYFADASKMVETGSLPATSA